VSRSVDQVRGIDLRATPRAERIVGVVETDSRNFLAAWSSRRSVVSSSSAWRQMADPSNTSDSNIEI
jgi:hypothetical protein